MQQYVSVFSIYKINKQLKKERKFYDRNSCAFEKRGKEGRREKFKGRKSGGKVEDEEKEEKVRKVGDDSQKEEGGGRGKGRK